MDKFGQFDILRNKIWTGRGELDNLELRICQQLYVKT